VSHAGDRSTPFAKASIVHEQHCAVKTSIFNFSPEFLASFTYPFAKNTGENRSLRLFLASLDSNELERDCLPGNDQICTL